jgi:hypothetical protein
MRRAGVVGIVASMLAVWVGGMSGAVASTPPKIVAIYGDSLVWESTAQAQLHFGSRYQVVSRAVPNTAPCDWIPQLESDLATLHPAVVEVATAGATNGSGSCEQNEQNSPEMLADYEAALTTITQHVTATSAQLVFVEDPPFLDPARNATGIQIAADELALAYQYPNVSVYTAARKALSTTTNGGYETYAKCLRTETVANGCDPATKLIAIRTTTGSLAGVNFCPDGNISSTGCDEYSSGEVRFGGYLTTAAQRPKPLYGTNVTPAPRVLVYGDSLMDEAMRYMNLTGSTLTGTTGLVKGAIGRAPCDYLKTITATISVATDLVVIESGANASTKCMLEPGSTKTHLVIGSTEWEQRYEADYDSIFALGATHGVKVLVIDPPPMDPDQHGSAIRNDLIDTVFPWLHADAAANYPLVSFSSDARDAVGGDTFTKTLPCLPDETAAMGCNDGAITVRAPDGLHFCPTGLGNQKRPCGLPYDPGARRFGEAIETATRAHI